jgi:hypothetical protein
MINTNYDKLKELYSKSGVGSHKQFSDIIDKVAMKESAIKKRRKK